MDYQAYLEEVFRVQVQHPSWRTGQTMFNVLSEQRPDISGKLVGTELDPFYADHAPNRRDRINKFLSHVRDNW